MTTTPEVIDFASELPDQMWERVAKAQIKRALEALAELEVPAGEYDAYHLAAKKLEYVREQLDSAGDHIDRVWELRFPEPGEDA